MAGELENPTKKVKSVKSFNCPSCGAPIILRALGHSVTVVCGSCGSSVDANNENFKLLAEAKSKLKVEPLIPLGTRGKLRGTQWEVIGFMQRKGLNPLFSFSKKLAADDSTDESIDGFVWSEYLLFNPTKGFRWLTESDGHWAFVTMTKERPIEGQVTTFISYRERSLTTLKGESFYLFDEYDAKVTYVIGEFYWRVKVNEKVRICDYIAPPKGLSLEKSKTELNWSLSEYFKPEIIQAAFSIKEALPSPVDVAPTQPSPYFENNRYLLRTWGIILIVLTIIQLYGLTTAKNQVLTSQDFTFQTSDTEKTKISQSFQMPNSLGNIEIELQAPVQNSWLEVSGELINENSGENFEFENGVEFYSGSDSDGAWSEGSQYNTRLISMIPGGNYHLNFESSSDSTPKTLNYHLTVISGVKVWSNFIWSIFLVSLLPIIIWYLNRRFEMNRWANSDYNPYIKSDDGDDNHHEED